MSYQVSPTLYLMGGRSALAGATVNCVALSCCAWNKTKRVNRWIGSSLIRYAASLPPNVADEPPVPTPCARNNVRPVGSIRLFAGKHVARRTYMNRPTPLQRHGRLPGVPGGVGDGSSPRRE
jgi:hypothetical protein